MNPDSVVALVVDRRDPFCPFLGGVDATVHASLQRCCANALHLNLSCAWGSTTMAPLLTREHPSGPLTVPYVSRAYTERTYFMRVLEVRSVNSWRLPAIPLVF